MPALTEIQRRIARGFLPALLLDFDGTLSPIEQRPSEAKLPKRTRGTLEVLSRRIPIAIISGRDLADVEARVGISHIAYAGCHGLAWSIAGKKHSVPMTTAKRRALDTARSALLELVPRSPGVIVEDKTFSFALNYRALHSRKAHDFVQEAAAVVSPKQVRILNELRTFEVIPKTTWNKGECAAMLLRTFQLARGKKLFPIYLGDSETDEDAFKKLRSGVTIRIGGKAHSAAQYSLPRSSVDAFLEKMLSLT